MKINHILDHSLPSKRAFSRGTWVFTSLISNQTKWLFLDDHLDRLLKGADYLFPEMNWGSKRAEIKKRLEAEWKTKSYLKVGIIEDELFFYHEPHAPLAQQSMKVAIASSRKSENLLPSFLKTPAFLVAELEKKKNKEMDDVLFLDESGYLTEASTSNLFLVLNDREIHTPKTSSKVLEGVLRKRMIGYLRENGFVVTEKDIKTEEIKQYCEIWLSNCVQGLRSVSMIQEHWMQESEKIYHQVVAKFGRFGENNE